jgi:hypothetical protein
MLAGDTVPSEVSELLSPIVTGAVGLECRLIENVAGLPPSVVVREVGFMVNGATYSTVTQTLEHFVCVAEPAASVPDLFRETPT